MTTLYKARGIRPRNQRRYMVIIYKRGNLPNSGIYTFHYTRWMAFVSASFFTVLGLAVELIDRGRW